MTNAKKFKEVFGIYAPDLLDMSEEDFNKWLGQDLLKVKIKELQDKYNYYKRLQSDYYHYTWIDEEGMLQQDQNIDKIVKAIDEARETMLNIKKEVEYLR